jgi:hypothetical protein
VHRTSGQRDPAAAFTLLATRDDTQERQQADRDRGTRLLRGAVPLADQLADPPHAVDGGLGMVTKLLGHPGGAAANAEFAARFG